MVAKTTKYNLQNCQHVFFWTTYRSYSQRINIFIDTSCIFLELQTIADYVDILSSIEQKCKVEHILNSIKVVERMDRIITVFIYWFILAIYYFGMLFKNKVSKNVFEDKNSQEYKTLSGYLKPLIAEVCEPLPGEQSVKDIDYRFVYSL